MRDFNEVMPAGRLLLPSSFRPKKGAVSYHYGRQHRSGSSQSGDGAELAGVVTLSARDMGDGGGVAAAPAPLVLGAEPPPAATAAPLSAADSDAELAELLGGEQGEVIEI